MEALFSAGLTTLRFWMCGFRPLLKLRVQTQAVAMVATSNDIVMTANTVRAFRAGRYSMTFCMSPLSYMRTSLKMK